MKKKTDVKVKMNKAGLERAITKIRSKSTALVLTGLCFFAMVPILAHRDFSSQPEPKGVESWWGFTKWMVGLEFFVAFGAGFLGLGLGERDSIKWRVSDILNNKKIADQLNSELVKLAPIFKSMYKNMLIAHPKLEESLKTGEIGDKNAETVAKYIDEYLKSHPKDAEKFLSVLVIADLPQESIDRYIAKYVPHTLSFNKALELAVERS